MAVLVVGFFVPLNSLGIFAIALLGKIFEMMFSVSVLSAFSALSCAALRSSVVNNFSFYQLRNDCPGKFFQVRVSEVKNAFEIVFELVNNFSISFILLSMLTSNDASTLVKSPCDVRFDEPEKKFEFVRSLKQINFGVKYCERRLVKNESVYFQI